jgi:hypothetical protein
MCSINRAYQIVSDKSVEPASEFVLLLDDVVADGPATGVLWFGPLESDGLVVEVHDTRLTRSSGRF